MMTLQKGSSLTVISSRFPSAAYSDIEFPSGDNWVLLAPGFETCPRCDGRATVVFRIENFNPMTGIFVFCATESKVYKPIELDHEFLNDCEDSVREVLKNIDVSNVKQIRFEDLPKTKKVSEENLPPSVTTMTVEVDSLVASVPVPDGYRNVSWLKKHEAEAIKKAYEKERSIPVQTSSGKQIFIAEWMAGTKDSSKYHASVKASRVRQARANKVVGWIRREEAEAVLKALAVESDIHFDHLDYGNGGLVQYFPKGSIEEITFRSCTRLLRKF